MLTTDSGLLVPTYGRRKMPYPEKFEKALRGISHGWEPKKGSLKDISPDKAAAMLAEAKRKGKRDGHAKALKEA